MKYIIGKDRSQFEMFCLEERIDEIFELTGNQTKNKYTKKLRRIAVWDEENEQEIELILLINLLGQQTPLANYTKPDGR